MKLILIHPPLDDPTRPYHAVAYLLGALQGHGFRDTSVRDLNAEFVTWCLQRTSILYFYSEAALRLRAFKAKAALTAVEQDEYLCLWTARRHSPARLAEAVCTMRQFELFRDYEAYQEAAGLINDYFSLLGALSYPAAISNFQQSSAHRFSVFCLDDLLDANLLTRVSYPFACFFREQLIHDREISTAECVGVSVTYDHQLTYSLWLANALKQRWPKTLLVFGGTAISQYYKHLRDKTQIGRFFDRCDAIVAGEGESAICEIAQSRGEFARLKAAPNTITYDRSTNTVHFPSRTHYESLADLCPPVYSHRWELYLSPYRSITYSPTRGCYWSRCAFCDYGLNDSQPTSPWRERGIDQVIADLKAVVAQERVRYVYFGADSIAPEYLERLSDAIMTAGIRISWSVELRMEKTFTVDRCLKLARSGCVCVSFGMESGNQRILDMIDKGTNEQSMSETMKNVTHAGIAVQLMAFQGFPSESTAERESTIRFIRENSAFWSHGWLGTFRLTGSSIVAKNPAKFGITLREIDGADCRRVVAYDTLSSDGKPQGSSEVLAEGFEEWFHNYGGVFPRTLGRPWAGGTDTLHSMIYYRIHGSRCFRDCALMEATKDTAAAITGDIGAKTVRLVGKLTCSTVNFKAMLMNRECLWKYKRDLLTKGIEPTYGRLTVLETSMSLLTRDASTSYWIASDTACAQLSRFMCDMLEVVSGSGKSLAAVMRKMDCNQRPVFLEYIGRLANAGLIEVISSEDRAGLARRIRRIGIRWFTCISGVRGLSVREY